MARSVAFDLRAKILNGHNLLVVIAGSILRKKDIVHDIDILVSSLDENIRRECSRLITPTGNSGYIPYYKISGKYQDIPTQIWFCSEDEWAPHLLEVTGPMNFNQFIRGRAKSQKMYLSNKAN